MAANVDKYPTKDSLVEAFAQVHFPTLNPIHLSPEVHRRIYECAVFVLLPPDEDDTYPEE